jgi:hypothetical protein
MPAAVQISCHVQVIETMNDRHAPARLATTALVDFGQLSAAAARRNQPAGYYSTAIAG